MTTNCRLTNNCSHHSSYGAIARNYPYPRGLAIIAAPSYGGPSPSLSVFSKSSCWRYAVLGCMARRLYITVHIHRQAMSSHFLHRAKKTAQSLRRSQR